MLKLPRRGYRFVAPVERERELAEPVLAVLPFANLNHDPQKEYLADGITDVLITELASLSELRVISRQSILHLKGSALSLEEVARELNVDAVVEGSVLHVGDRLRISAQLVGRRPERHLWAQAYESDLSGILAFQRQAARAIAEAVRATLNTTDLNRVSRSESVDPQAQEAFLKARYYGSRWSREGLQRALEYLREAIAKDPGYAAAHAVLADSLSMLGYWGHLPLQEAYPPAKEAALQALALDPGLSLAHKAMAWVAWVYDWDLAECERRILRAIELAPSNEEAHMLYAVFLATVRQDREKAAGEARVALKLDPLSMFTNSSVAWVYLFLRDYERAARQAQETLELYPDSLQAFYVLGWAKLRCGKLPAALAAFEKCVKISRDPLSVGYLGYAWAQAGRKTEAKSLLKELLTQRQQAFLPHKSLVCLYTGLGDNDRAFECLERAYADRDPMLFWLPVAPPFDSLHSDPRFGELVRRLGLAWQVDSRRLTAEKRRSA